MLRTLNVAADQFLPGFFGKLFAQDELVRVSWFDPPGSLDDENWRNAKVTAQEALRWALQNRAYPNVYFAPSAFRLGAGYTSEDCAYTRAFFVDLDVDSAARGKPAAFETLDDAAAYLLTMPLKPTCAWVTGYGVQAGYLLTQPYLFQAGGGLPGSLERYKEIGRKLAEMAMADDAFTPEHPYRIPLSLHDKRAKGCEPRWGQVLLEDWRRQHTVEEIEQAVSRYGIKDIVKRETGKASSAASLAASGKASSDAVTDNNEEDGTAETDAAPQDVAYEDLPPEIRAEVEDIYPEGTRSTEFHRVVGLLMRHGYSEQTIQLAMPHGPSFREKYPDRMRGEVQRSMRSIEHEGIRVFAKYQLSAIELPVTPIPVLLADCAPLPADLEAMLTRYKDLKPSTPEQVRNAARFHEHAFQQGRTGVLDSPCGSGKSTWAKCHIALNAKADKRYIYVVETIDTLYEDAALLEQLGSVAVGRVHGFDEDRCKALCGQVHEWKECGRRNSKAVCHTCEARERCHYYNRDAEERKPIVVSTHAGMIRWLESNNPILDGAVILVDEDIARFSTHDFGLDELQYLRLAVDSVYSSLANLFPGSRLAEEWTLREKGIPPEAPTYAACNYIYRTAAETAAALQPFHETLRRLIGTSRRETSAFSRPSLPDAAYDLITKLLNAFRPSRLGDNAYAFHEYVGERGIRYVVKKILYDLGADRPYAKLWILNASARLAALPYPDNVHVYTCPDLPDGSELVRLHTVTANPFKSKQAENVELTRAVLTFSNILPAHREVLIVTNADGASLQPLTEQMGLMRRRADLSVRHMTRGRMRGANSAGNCTLALLSGVSTFTSLHDTALFAALVYQRTFPHIPFVFLPSGTPNMQGGRLPIPAANQFFALSTLDIVYQSVWRTAARNGKPVEAVAVLAEPEWFVALVKSVMPHVALGKTYLVEEPDEKQRADYQAGMMARKAHSASVNLPEAASDLPVHFDTDPRMNGLRQVIELEQGTILTKDDAARVMGYGGKNPWKENRARLAHLLEPFFHDVRSRKHSVRRK